MARSFFSSLFSGTVVNEPDAARRRRLIEAELLPEAFSPVTKPGAQLKHLRVGIVGGGFAGLMTAWFLQECGVGSVLVFEQLDRVGGRVHTDRTLIPGKLVEAGAELIGSNHLLWLELADRFGLGLTPLTDDKGYLPDRVRLLLGGRDLTSTEIEKLHDGLLKHLDAIGSDARPISPHAPWTHPDADRYDSMSVADKLDELNLEPLQRELLEFTLGNDACAPVDVQSYLGLLTLVSAGRIGSGDTEEEMRGYWDVSEKFRCAQGNQALAEQLTVAIEAGPGIVRKNTKALRIDIVDELAAAITTDDGSIHEVDRVVLAVPAPQWGSLAIEPPIPASEFVVGHGPAVKYVAVYDGLDWPGGGLAPSVKWDELGSVWETTDRQQPAGPPHGLTVFSGGSLVLLTEADYANRLAQLYPGMTPIRSAFFDWSTTGYSVPLVGQVTTVGERLTRAHAGVLRVAGEQTSMGFYGYMEGALQSGARVAGAILRDVLGLTLPVTPSSGLCLPLGHTAGGSTAQLERCAELAQVLARGSASFAGDNVDQLYSVPVDAPAYLRSVHALWAGNMSMDGNSVTVKMPISMRLRLGSLLGEDTPLTLSATYGAVTPTRTTGAVIAGEELGTLVGTDFRIRFQDQHGFYLHPLAVIDAFDKAGLWSDTGGARCPLLPDPADTPPMAVTGPVIAEPGIPHLVLAGGSRGWIVNCPPAKLPERYLSFLSNDPITISVAAMPQAGAAQLVIHDDTDSTYRTLVSNPVQVDLDAEHVFVAETALRPNHLEYGAIVNDPPPDPGVPPKPGRLVPGAALTYKIAVVLPDGTQLSTVISQDVRDVIRQEYRFHSPPFHNRAEPLAVPDRSSIETANRPWFASHFTAEEFATSSNYGPLLPPTAPALTSSLDPENSFMLNGTETFQVAEYLRGRYAEHIAQRRAANPAAIPDTVTPALHIGSNWRNPERNENAGGVWNSNHQSGFALDIDPPQVTGSALDIELLQCLFAAAGDLLRELVDRNGVAAFGKIEFFLEHKPRAILWQFTANRDGTVTDAAGTAYQTAWGDPPSLAAAAAHATHLHVAWPPRRLDRRLDLPPVTSEQPIAQPTAFRNVILIASEDSSVPESGRLPLNHLADTVKAYLADIDPQTPTDIHEVSDAIGWLRPLQAFQTPTYKIRRLFSFSHAWPGGLDLKHYPRGTNYESDIHDPLVLERLTQLYDPRLFADTSIELLPTGTDDERTVKTNQIRISNLRWLPAVVKARLRRTFAQSEGVYIVGCRTAQEDGVPHPPFCSELANVIGRQVRGAAYYSKLFSPEPGGGWEERTVTRSSARPDEQPLVLVPGSYGTFQLVGYVATEGLPPQIPGFPPTSDLLEIYETFLRPTDPEEL